MEPQDAISGFITALLLYIMYPALMIGMLLWLVFAIRNLIVSDYLGSPMRRIAAAVLPVTMLIFFLVLTKEQPVSELWQRVDKQVPMLSFGGSIGLVLMVTTTYFTQRDEELAPVMHSFILSLILCFILYCIVRSDVNNLQFFFLGMIMACCFYIMFRGTDDLGVMKGPRYAPPPPPAPRFRQTYAPPPGGPGVIAPAQIPHPGPYGDPTMPPPEATVIQPIAVLSIQTSPGVGARI